MHFSLGGARSLLTEYSFFNRRALTSKK